MVVIVKLSFQCKTLFKMAKKIWASKYLGNYSIARYTRVALLNIYWQMLALSILQVICCFYNVQVLNFDYLWLILQRVMEGLATHTVWDRIRAIFIPSLSQLFFFFPKWYEMLSSICYLLRIVEYLLCFYYQLCIFVFRAI